ncbi:MAG: DEAD/DEAH box helicase [Actinobacteria bacterium]|nr:DEAD/DEAH box helicase [Actinomycetota bacterium]MCG2800951.1 DEAD/DEAH box helicase [Cellulomonas sp.]
MPGPGEPSPAQSYAAARRRARAPQLTTFAAGLAFDLDDFQLAACAALEEGRGVLVAAPTGAGKTVVGEFAVHLALAGGRKAFYTTPIKALSNQKYADLVALHGVDKIGLLTGDTSVNGDAPVVVMTTEVLRNMLYASSPALDDLGYVVLDEVHYLADRFRGPVWEEVILQLAESVQIVCLSATVSNAEEFGDWLTTVRGPTEVVVSEHRPVPLGQHVLLGGRLADLYARRAPGDGREPPLNPDLVARLRAGASPDGHGPGRRGRPGDRRSAPRPAHPASRLVTVDALERADLLPAIVFIFSRAGCQAAVDQCVAAGVRLTSPQEDAEIRSTVERRCAAIPVEDLAVLGVDQLTEALRRGVGAHHAGMLPLFKETVEDLFSRGLVKVVFATETLALGINMPARCVVLDSLVKWDGSRMADITAGEYTQLTGRAGRRGIDTEGHAVVLGRPGLDPEHVAGLASRRLYPLRSAFAPTYNMAVNLVWQVGRERARDVLETSFAQYQADQAVVGLARTSRANKATLAELETAMACHLGDFGQYAALRRELSGLEKGVRPGEPDAAARAQAVASLTSLRRGDVVLIPSGRRPVHAVVVDLGGPAGFDGPRPTVLTPDARVRQLTAADVGPGLTAVGRLHVPETFSPRAPHHRRELAARLRAHDAVTAARHKGRGARDDAAIAALRRALKAHPCHACPQREEHARWAERYTRLQAEQEALTRRIASRAGSIAVVFDRVCEVLVTLGYLDQPSSDVLVVTAAGQGLRRLYSENDLLLAECLRTGALADLDPPGLAAAVSALVYRSRRDPQTAPRVPGGPGSRLGRTLDEMARAAARVATTEREHSLTSATAIDLGLVEAVHRWALGRSLTAVLQDVELEAGDFVRWVKQVIDVLGQLSAAASDAALRAAAESAAGALRRGVVAYASV